MKLRVERDVLAESDVKNRISGAAMVPLEGSTPDQLKSFVKAEIEVWAQVVNRAGIAGSQ